jgi:CHAT domain-containing protein
MRRRPLVLVLALALAAVAPGVADVPTLEACDERVRSQPDDGNSYYCYLLAVRAHGRGDEACRRLEAHLSVRPDQAWARLNLGAIEDLRGSPRAADLYRAAAEQMRAREIDAGEVIARQLLSRLLAREQRFVEAEAELARAEEPARRSGDEVLVAWLHVGQGNLALAQLDFARARRLYELAAAAVFPEAPADVQNAVLSGLGNVAWRLGDFAEAAAIFEREAALWRRLGDRYQESLARMNLVLSLAMRWDRMEIDRLDLEPAVREALELARAAGNLPAEANLRVWLAHLMHPAEGLAETDEALRLCARHGYAALEHHALLVKARQLDALGAERRDEALRLVDRVVEEARARGDLFTEIRGLAHRATISATHAPRAQVVGLFHDALDAIERARARQVEPAVQVRIASEWSATYHHLASFTLHRDRPEAASHADIDLALGALERLRGRLLREQLEQSASLPSPTAAATAVHEELGAVRRAIAGLQSALTDAGLAASERATRRAELERHEARESDLLARLARLDPRCAAVYVPYIAPLAEIQAALRDDEAMLVYQLPVPVRPELEGPLDGAHVIVVTRADARAFPAPSPRELAEQVPVFLGLVERRDGRDARAGRWLHDALLGPALAWLDDRVARLVIVPDGPIHSLPLGALRAAGDDAPLATRYACEYAPSASLWTRWRRETRPPTAHGALVFADPRRDAVPAAAGAAFERALEEGLRLGSLPLARREGRAMIRRLRGGRLLAGPAASEASIKSLDLAAFDVLHFATHAVVSTRHPQRSAIVLAPGGPDEDGLLQPREIADLDLAGKVIVLSACRSAEGRIYAGEGVVGLARAFFQAGASTVVGSLWPLRDEDAEAVVGELARQLGRGRSVTEALAAAQRWRIADGAPTAAWAGLVVLGDGSAVVAPHRPSPPRILAVALAMLAGGVVVAVAYLRGRRRWPTAAARSRG